MSRWIVVGLLVLLAVILFQVSKRGYIQDATLDRLDKIASVLSLLTALVVVLWTPPDPPKPVGMPSPMNCPRRINFGQVVQCSIDKNSEVDTYIFTATKGDNITIAMTPDSGALEPEFELLQPTRTQVSGCTVGGAGRAEGNCTAPSTGDYTLLVSDNLGNKTGTYTIIVSRKE